MPVCSRVLLLGLVTLLMAWSLGVPAMALQGESHGINVADMDLTVSPRADFYRFANGGWLDSVTLMHAVTRVISPGNVWPN